MPLIFEPVRFPKPEREYVKGRCPRCGETKVYEALIPCPDGIPGCLVAHHGYICDYCGAILQVSEKNKEG